ncbi:ABC transporter substrate-binding protein [Amnibacterium flavum]|nr:extracellular solute-binding protein [Amnibacterium flavum]
MPIQSKQRRRLLLAVGVTAVAGLALGACSSPAPEASSDPDAPVSLRLSVEAGAVDAPVAVLAAKYSEEHPNITFEVEAVPNEQYGEVLRTQLQGGNAPDVFYVTGGNGNAHSALPLAEAGYLVDLSGTVAEELFTDSTRSLSEYDGKIWTQPYDFVPIVNNYNVTVAEELGIELPFTSVDDVLDACAVATDAGKTLLRLAGAAVPNAGLTTLQMAATRVYADDPEWNQKRLDGDVTFADTKGWTESLELILELRDAGCFQEGVEAGVIADNVPAIAAGTSLGGFAPGGQVGDLRRVNPDNEYLSTAFPGDKGEKWMFASPTNMLALNASSDEAKQKAGMDFLAWLAEPENADELAATSGNLSIRAGSGAALPDQYQYISDYFTDESYQPLANLQWPSPEVYNTLGTGVQGLLTGQTTVDAVLKAMDAAWDSAAG